MKSKKGLTLIEIVAVIAILGIVLGIAVVNISKYKKTLDQKNRENAIRNVLFAARMYYTKNHTMECLPTGTVTCAPVSVGGGIYGNYLKVNDYVKYDKKYENDDYNGVNFFTTPIKREKCGPINADEVRYFFSISYTVSGIQKYYDDCGCEVQSSTGVAPDIGKELCTNGNGKYKPD